MKKSIIFTLFVLSLFIGCGSGSHQQTEEFKQLDKTSKNYFGALADSKIEIYEITDGKKLLFSETTSMGDTLEDIGNFNSPVDMFEKSKFYQLQLKGGKNWDIDKDGKKDATFTPNKKVYRTIYKGKRAHVAWWSVQTNLNTKNISE